MNEQKFKKGDIVVVTKQYSNNEAKPGMIVKLINIDTSNVPYNCQDFLNRYNWKNNNDWCKDVRKPTYEELASIGIYSESIYEIF